MNAKVQAQYLRAEKVVIGARLRAARERARASIYDAAEAAGVQVTAIDSWERGRIMPCLVQFRDLLELYGTTAHPILFGAGPVELTATERVELARAAREFSPALRRKLELLAALLAQQPVESAEA